MPDDKPPIADHERRLVLPPDEMLRDQRDRLQAELDATAGHLAQAHREVDRLDERDRLLRAALADLDAALGRLHLKPVRFTDAAKPQ